MIRRLLAPAVALCATAALATTGPFGAQAAPLPAPSTEEPAVSPLRLTAPTTVHGSAHRGRVDFDPGLRLVAQGAPFEVWSKRPAWRKRIVTEVRSSRGTVTLPEGVQSGFSGLPGLVKLLVRDEDGRAVRRVALDVCLNSWQTERVRPEAALRSPYPEYCPGGRWTKGSVQGIQEGWASKPELYRSIRLAPGHYRVTAYIPPFWRNLLGISRADGKRVFTLDASGGGGHHGHDRRAARSAAVADPAPRPAAQEPASAAAGEPADVRPDLQSLPAFGIRVSRGGNHLQFSATVWNAGDSPLIVDGFRREDEPVMDAYQYFVDADGNQTGYQEVGELEYDTKDTHEHWHFRDFARYRLLDADRRAVVRSRKEAFCLANTDATDYTVPGADWKADRNDLHTACGEPDSLSIREVLSAGSGDTYAQFRAGQSFRLKGLPNGVYYISVEANPQQRLVEHHLDNNETLRRVRIGGVAGARTVKVRWIAMP